MQLLHSMEQFHSKLWINPVFTEIMPFSKQTKFLDIHETQNKKTSWDSQQTFEKIVEAKRLRNAYIVLRYEKQLKSEISAHKILRNIFSTHDVTVTFVFTQIVENQFFVVPVYYVTYSKYLPSLPITTICFNARVACSSTQKYDVWWDWFQDQFKRKDCIW